MHLSDLHAALLRVQSERERWREWATSSTHPVVSERVEELAAVQARFVEDLEGLAIALEGSSTGADLLGLPIDRLRETLDGLINDEENLAVLPERTVLLDELRERDDQSLFELCTRLAVVHQVTSSRQAVSQHLAVLEAAGLVRTRRSGRTKLHTLSTAPLRAVLERWPLPTEESP